MIQQIEATNFRCFSWIQQPLNHFQVLIGPNATGKSTFLDVIEFLSECLNEGLLQAIEKRTSNFFDLLHKGQGQSFGLAVVFSVPERLREEHPEYDRCRYQMAIGQEDEDDTISILSESFWLLKKDAPLTRQKSTLQLSLVPMSNGESTPPRHLRAPTGWRTVVNKTAGGNDYFKSETTEWNFTLRLGATKSAFANLPGEEERFPIANWAKRQLTDGVRFIQLNSRQMRLPCSAFAPTEFALDGSNLPKVIQSVQWEKKRFARWFAHLRQALPDVKEILVRERPEDRSLYLVLRYQGGYEVPSWLLSDGTLRLLALTLIAYLQKEENTYLIEEPENGVHPTALEIIFQSLSSVYDSQVLLATHSPVLLSLAKPEQLLCFRLEEGAAYIRTGSETPALQNWSGVPDMGVLFATGIL